MTSERDDTPADRLASVRARLEATLQDPAAAVSGGLVGLEADVAAICGAVHELPPKEAHALAPEMKHVIGLLELLAKAMEEASQADTPSADSASLRRQAAAAYGSGRPRKN